MRSKLHLIALCIAMVAMLAACGGEAEKKDKEADVKTGEVAAGTLTLVLLVLTPVTWLLTACPVLTLPSLSQKKSMLKVASMA